MIGQVLRLSTVFANMMLASSLALSMTIAVAGTIERTTAGCHGCVSTGHALGVRPSKPALAKTAPAPVAQLGVAGTI